MHYIDTADLAESWTKQYEVWLTMVEYIYYTSMRNDHSPYITIIQQSKKIH